MHDVAVLAQTTNQAVYIRALRKARLARQRRHNNNPPRPRLEIYSPHPHLGGEGRQAERLEESGKDMIRAPLMTDMWDFNLHLLMCVWGCKLGDDAWYSSEEIIHSDSHYTRDDNKVMKVLEKCMQSDAIRHQISLSSDSTSYPGVSRVTKLFHV